MLVVKLKVYNMHSNIWNLKVPNIGMHIKLKPEFLNTTNEHNVCIEILDVPHTIVYNHHQNILSRIN